MTRPRLLVPLLAAITAGAFLSACSGGAATSSPASSTAVGPEDTLTWCQAYGAVTKTLSAAQPTMDGANTVVRTLESFDQLWQEGEARGYVTTEESAANHRAVDAYARMMSLVANGKAADSPEVTDASKNLVDVTTKDQALLQASSTKIQNLCAPITALSPSSSATRTP